MSYRKDPHNPKTTRKTFKLAARAAAGDDDAERLLHDHLRPWLLQQLERRQPPRGIDLESVVQEAFLGLFGRLGDLVDDANADGDGEVSVRGRLLIIGKRRLTDAARKLARRGGNAQLGDGETGPLADDFPDAKAHRPSSEARCKELLARLSACLPQLTPQRQQIVRLYLLEGRPRDEVVAALGMTRTAFGSELSRVRDQLEALLGLTPRRKPQ